MSQIPYMNDLSIHKLANNFNSRIKALQRISSSHASFNERAKLFGCYGIISRDEYNQLRANLGAKSCFWCDGNLGNRWALDHVFPLSKRGPNIVENLVESCFSCNSKKSNKDPFLFCDELGINRSILNPIINSINAVSRLQDAYRQHCVYLEHQKKYHITLCLVKNFNEYMAIRDLMVSHRFILRLTKTHTYRCWSFQTNEEAKKAIGVDNNLFTIIEMPDYMPKY